MSTLPLSRQRLLALLALIIVLIGLVYYPGLSGDYVFDDSANILENKKLAIDSLSWAALNSAAFSGDAGPLGRPLSMLSFAINYYFTGFDPFYFKLTNLTIHILNTLLIFLISRQVFTCTSPPASYRFPTYAALTVALLWGLHPLNLTSVLYIVQRMVSLSTLFGLLALYIYGHLRLLPRKPGTVSILVWLVSTGLLIIATALSKESGVLFIPLMVLLELFVFRGQYQGRDIRCFGYKLTHLLYGLALLAGLIVLTQLPKFTNPAAFLHRDFTLTERLLTETRVIIYYLKLFFFPRITELSLYHDDFIISKSITEPISTLYAVGILACISLICLALVRKAPMLLFAWCWFLIGHALESTFISLELVHEHRNYFAIIGLVMLYPFLYHLASRKIKPLLLVLLAAYCAHLAFATWQRAIIWSNLVDHASFEAIHHPQSERANYQLARIYIKLIQQNEDDPKHKAYYAQLAENSITQARHSYKAANGGWFAHLHLSYYLGQEPQPQIIEELKTRLYTLPFYNNNISFLNAFANCQIEQYCKLPHHQAVEILAAAAENPTINSASKAEVFKMLARYFAGTAGDYLKAEEFLLDALQLQDDVHGHLLLAQVYGGLADADKAQTQLDYAKRLDSKNTWYREIQHEQSLLDMLRTEQTENGNVAAEEAKE